VIPPSPVRRISRRHVATGRFPRDWCLQKLQGCCVGRIHRLTADQCVQPRNLSEHSLCWQRVCGWWACKKGQNIRAGECRNC